MIERGIPFSAPMVGPVMDGTKTQTRRIVRELGGNRGGPVGDHVHWFERGREDATRWCGHDGLGSVGWVRCPYGEPGDRLWVREAWRTVESLDEMSPAQLDPKVPVYYEADGAIRGKPREKWGRYRHGRFMPRWASRTTLDNTDVRVERLQQITEEDARAEGVKLGELVDAIVNGERSKVVYFEARTAFAHLWCGINGADSWKANPWVWAVSFKRVVEPNWDAPITELDQANLKEHAR